MTLSLLTCDSGPMTRRKEGLVLIVLGATALVLSAPWWLLGTLSFAGLGPRLGVTMGVTFVFLGFLWMFKRDREGRPVRRRKCRVVRNSASEGSPRKRPD